MIEQDAPTSPDSQPLSQPAVAVGTPSAGRRVALNAFNPFVAQLFTKLLMLVYVSLQYRLLSNGLLDGYIFAGNIFAYTSTVSEWGMGTLVSRDVARSRGSANEAQAASELFTSSFVLRLLISLGMFVPVAAIVVGYTAAGKLDAGGAWAVGILTLSLFPSAFSGSVTALLYAYERMSLPAGIGIATSALNVALGIGALVLSRGALGLAVPGLALAALLTTVVTAFVFLRILRREFPGVSLKLTRSSLAIERKEALGLLGIGWPLMLNALLNGLFFKVDVFIIQAVLPAGDLTHYNAAYSFLNFVLLISPAITLAFFPRMSRHAAGDRPRLLSEYNFVLKLLLIMAVPIVALTVWLAPLFITILSEGAPGYLPDSAVALQILIFFLPFSLVNGLTQYVLIALDRQRLITWAFGLAVIFNVAANVVLVPMMGIYGAALTTILTEILLLVPFTLWTQSAIGKVSLLGIAVRPLVAGAAVALVEWLLWPVEQSWQSNLGALALYLAAAILLFVVYAGVLLVTRPFSKGELASLMKVVKR